MKQLKCPWRTCAKLFLIPAGIFFALLIGATLIEIGASTDIDRRVIHLNFLIQMLVWCAISLVFYALSQTNAAKLGRLRNEGIEYEGQVADIRPLYGVNIFNNLTFRADCAYVNDEGKTCLVRSHAAMMPVPVWLAPSFRGARFRAHILQESVNVSSHGHGLTAKIYVNRQEPKDYAIELFESNGDGINADYDYR